MSQIYPEDRGQNYSIKMGEEVAAMAARTGRARLPVTLSEAKGLFSPCSSRPEWWLRCHRRLDASLRSA